MRDSKYNVDKNVSKRSINGIVFDSELEMKYYRDIILPAMGSGEIIYCDMQKAYELQPKFEHDGKTILSIQYIADFYIEYSNGDIVVVDVKGMADTTAKLKRKLFWYRFPDIKYIWVSYAKKYGGWLLYDDLQSARSKDKRRKKKNKIDYTG